MVAPTMEVDGNDSKKRVIKARRNGSPLAPTPTVSPHGAAVKSDLRSGEMRFAREIATR